MLCFNWRVFLLGKDNLRTREGRLVFTRVHQKNTALIISSPPLHAKVKTLPSSSFPPSSHRRDSSYRLLRIRRFDKGEVKWLALCEVCGGCEQGIPSIRGLFFCLCTYEHIGIIPVLVGASDASKRFFLKEFMTNI